MTSVIPDQIQRHRAIDASISCIVRAPAGSGKTELLIQRFLRLLSRVETPEEIVAITFTRKAAAEMQNRVLQALEMAAHEDQPDSGHARQRWQLARAALDRDDELDWQLMHNPARLKIQTIDALCAGLTRQLPVLSGLGAPPETVDDATALFEAAADNTLAELDSAAHWSDSIARLLIHLDNDMPRVKQLLVNMLAKRDQWLRHVVKEHQREELEFAMQFVISEKLGQLCALMPSGLEQDLCEVAAFAAGKLHADNPGHATMACQEISAYPGVEPEDIAAWLGLAELLLTARGDWRQKLDKRNGFPPAQGSPAQAELHRQMKQRCMAVIQRLGEVPALRETLQAVRELPPPHYADEEWEVVGALCCLLTLAEGQLRVKFAEKNQMDFTGVAHAAMAALGNAEAPSEVALALDYRIGHLLVDEYQDISVNQSLLLERLTEGWSGDDGHTLFLVGDPMQSIYRFREAEVGIFLNTWKHKRLGQVGLETLTIHTNFRSQPGLVEWVNRCFEPLMPPVEDITSGAVGFEPSTAYHNIQPLHSVTVSPGFHNGGQDEAQRLVRQLHSLRADDPHGSVAILVRSRRHLQDIVPALRDAGIGFNAIDIESLKLRPEIQDLLALIRAMAHPADRTAWLAILRAPWCGLKLDALLTLAGADPRRTLWDCLHDPALLSGLDSDTARRLQRFKDVLTMALALRRRHGFYRAIESAWVQLGGPALLRGRHELENVLTVLEALAGIGLAEQVEDLDGFIEDIAELFATPAPVADNPVQLMTIHKAKGLEFDHVLLPGLGRMTQRGASELLLWMQLPQHEQGPDLILAPIRETGRQEARIYEYVKGVEKTRQAHEAIRLLYVAITRAKKSLSLFGHVRVSERDGSCAPARGSFLDKLWPVLEAEYSAALAGANGEAPGEIVVIDPYWKRFEAGWSLPTMPPSLNWHGKSLAGPDQARPDDIEFEWAGETIKHTGSVLHRCLLQIAEDGIGTWDRQRVQDAGPWIAAQLLQLGVKADDVDGACADVARALHSLLEDDRGRWLLSDDHREARNEFALTGLFENRVIRVRIDRTFVDEEDTRWIIDYKSGRHEAPDIETFLDREQERYRDQLQKYAAIMQSLDDRPIMLGLYFPLLPGWRCWKAERS